MRILACRSKCFCLFIMVSLPLGGSTMFIQRIIKEKSEELNSPFGNMAFCKIKFHKGVEFNFASEACKMNCNRNKEFNAHLLKMVYTSLYMSIFRRFL